MYRDHKGQNSRFPRDNSLEHVRMMLPSERSVGLGDGASDGFPVDSQHIVTVFHAAIKAFDKGVAPGRQKKQEDERMHE